LVAGGVDGQRHAAVHGRLVQQYGATGTHPAIAIDLGAGHVELDAKSLRERGARLDVHGVLFAIHVQRNGERLGPVFLDVWRGLGRGFAKALHALDQRSSRSGDSRAPEKAAPGDSAVRMRAGRLAVSWLIRW